MNPVDRTDGDVERRVRLTVSTDCAEIEHLAPEEDPGLRAEDAVVVGASTVSDVLFDGVQRDRVGERSLVRPIRALRRW